MEAVADTQKKKILQHLRRGLSITPIDALQMFGCFRLGARVWDLKRDGHVIDREWETDGTKRWAKYRLVKGK